MSQVCSMSILAAEKTLWLCTHYYRHVIIITACINLINEKFTKAKADIAWWKISMCVESHAIRGTSIRLPLILVMFVKHAFLLWIRSNDARGKQAFAITLYHQKKITVQELNVIICRLWEFVHDFFDKFKESKVKETVSLNLGHTAAILNNNGRNVEMLKKVCTHLHNNALTP